MNPYSFKRFLQNHSQPTHSVQVVNSDVNGILVHGDLPDCVQNVSKKTPPLSLQDFSPSQIEEAHRHSSDTNSFASHELITSAMGELDPRMNDADHVANGFLASQSTLPDIQSVSALPNNNQQVPQNSDGDTRTFDLLSLGRQGFLMESRSLSGLEKDATETAASQWNNHHSWFKSASLSKLSNLVSRSESNRHQAGSLPGLAKRNNSCTPLGRSVSNMAADPSYNSTSAHLPEIFPHVSDMLLAASYSSSVSTGQDHPVVNNSHITTEQQQLQINMLAMQLNELEDQLQRTRALLADRELLLATVRAESEVVEHQATLKIKALEHELARERLRSAQDRWMVVQLKNQLTVRAPIESSEASNHQGPWSPASIMSSTLEVLASARPNFRAFSAYADSEHIPVPWPTISCSSTLTGQLSQVPSHIHSPLIMHLDSDDNDTHSTFPGHRGMKNGFGHAPFVGGFDNYQ